MNISRYIPGSLHTQGPGVQVSPTLYAADYPARAPELARHDARFHPHRTRYQVPAGLRAVAHAYDNPGCVVSGLSALTLLGLPSLANACDATMNTSLGRGSREWGLVRRRRKAKDAWAVNWHGLEIAVSAPADAVVEALQDIRDGIHAWEAPAWVSDPELLWAIQLVDASRRYLEVAPAEIMKAARGRLNRRWITKVLGLSSSLADSPKETEMRLLCSALTAPSPLIDQTWADIQRQLRPLGLVFAEQAPLYDGTRLITTFDLALVDLQIAVMYDGEHHLARDQRDKDFRIALDCQILGWTVVRVSAGTLEDLPRILLAVLREKGVV